MNARHCIVASPGTSDLEAKKSHFITQIRTVHSEEEARAFLEEVKKQHRDARHHCFAMRIGDPGSETERFSDDGEPQGTAGKPILALLKGADLYDVCAVVTRYFGGTLLGTGGLVRAYTDSCREALDRSEIHELKSGVRLTVTSDYPFADRLKYLAQQMGIFTENEEYGEKCTFTYCMDSGKRDLFCDKVREMSAGNIHPEKEQTLLYSLKGNTPIVYKEIV